MESFLIQSPHRKLLLALAVTVLASFVAQAVPYASCITNSAGTISYYLNENADAVNIIFDGGGPGNTNALGAQTKGPHSFALGAHTSYRIEVKKDAPVGWTLISDDTNPYCEYANPRGVAVSQVASNLSTFGRIYVSDSVSGSVVSNIVTTLKRTNWGKGVYILNADQSEAIGQTVVNNAGNIAVQALSNGITWGTPLTASSPWRIGVGEDNKLYLCSFGTVDATTWRSTTPDCSAFEQVLAGIGVYAKRSNHTDVASTPIARGSIEDGSLQLWVIDGTLTNSAGAATYNRICRYDIGAGPLPYDGPPAFVSTATAYSSVAAVTSDFEMLPDGRWMVSVNRSVGTDRASIQQYDTDAATVLFDSLSFYGSPDPLRNTVATALSPDGKIYAWITLTNRVNMMSFDASGIIDPATLTGFDSPASPSVTGPNIGNGRDIAWDAAGNLYTVSSGQARLRVFAPGGNTVASTSSDGTFTLTKPANEVSVLATTPTTSMDTSLGAPGVFTLSRSGSTASPLPVSYTLTGLALNGTHYQAIPTSVTFQAGADTTNIFITAIPTPAGPVRDVVLTINSGAGYTPVSPLNASVWIIDTNKPAIWVARKDAQFYERTNDFARFTLTRYGDTNTSPQINMTYGGTAVAGTHFYADAIAGTMIPGQVTMDVNVYPIHDGVFTGPLTVTATVAPASFGDYDVGTPATSVEAATRVNSDYPPETVIWSDNLQTDTSANWTERYGTTNGAARDATVTWAFDYSGSPIFAPPAPHSGSDTHGLYMTVNKTSTDLDPPVAAALNFYPNGQSFSGNYALRFDMFLIQNTGAATTEYALFGINHSGARTNWFRNSTSGFAGVDPTAWDFDGVFYAVESDAAALGDYVGYSSPTTAGRNPTPISPGRNASTLTHVFKTPPWTPGVGTGGAPANLGGSGTPIWADVELSHVNGVIRWYINHELIFAYTNTTGYGSGNIMLGYTDAYDSVGSGEGAVIYANARVISLAGPTITGIVVNGGNVEITFTANTGDVVGQFNLQQSSPLVTGGYADTTSTISSLGGGVFKAVKAVPAANTFYRISKSY